MANDRNINFLRNVLIHLLAQVPANFLFKAQNLLEVQCCCDKEKSCFNGLFFVTKEKVVLLKATAVINHAQEIYFLYGIKSYWYNFLDKWLKNDFPE